jgi:hypothetical protein
MAMIRSALELPTLQILIAPRRERVTEALFQVVRGADTPTEVARCSLGDLGLPSALTGMDPVDDRNLTIPADTLSALDKAISAVGPSPLAPTNALWLEFPSPRGFLYIMPWERLLAPLGRRIFRLPNHLIRPHAPERMLEVAICTSVPMAKTSFDVSETLQRVTQQYEAASPRGVAVHVFTDSSSYRHVARDFSADGRNIVVHDPVAAAELAPPNRSRVVSSEPRMSSPWLLWMRNALRGRPLDFVHFVSHGYMSGDQGAIAMAMSPTVNTDRGLSQFIGSAEMNTFLSQVGAWGLVLTGPYDNYSDAGLRELADSIAQSRPGIAITHDGGRDDDSHELGMVLKSVLDPQSASGPSPSWSAITCWVHPKSVDYPVEYQDELHLNADGSSTFITGATRNALADEGTASWVASATRVLETQQMRWLPDSIDEPPDNAAVTALRNVADLVDRHVEQTYGKEG